MSFYRIFNLIYKLFSKRGLKAFVLSLLIIAIIFIFSNKVFAYSTNNDELNPVAWSNYPTSIDDVMSFLEDNENLYSSLITYNEILSANTLIYKDGSRFELFINYGNNFEYSSEFQGQSWYDLTSYSNSVYIFISNELGGIFRYKYNDWVASKSASMLADTTNFKSNYDVFYDNQPFISATIDGSGGSGGGSSGSSPDYSDLLGHINEQVTNTNTIVQDIATTTNSIDNRVAQIQGALVSQNSEVSNAVYNSATNTQNMILQGQIQSQNNFNTITNTTAYNSSDVYIDTSFNDISDTNGVDNFIRSVFNRLNTFFNNLNFDNSIEFVIPIPFTNKTCTISTAPIQQFYSDNPILAGIITMSWYFVFGVYIFRIAYTFWLSAVNGTILKDSEGFTAKMDEFGVIKFFMM